MISLLCLTVGFVVGLVVGVFTSNQAKQDLNKALDFWQEEHTKIAKDLAQAYDEFDKLSAKLKKAKK